MAANRLYEWDKYLARLLMCSFFVPLRMQVLVLIPLCLFFACRDLMLQKGKRKIPIWHVALLGSIYLIYAVYLPFASGVDKRHLLFDLEQKASLLLIPLMVACLQKSTIDSIRKELHYFVLGCMLTGIIANGQYIFSIFPFKDTQLLNHVFYRRYIESCTSIHPTYMGMYLCFAIAIILLYGNAHDRLRAWQLAAAIFLLSLFLFALLPKTPLIALFFVLGYYCCLHYREKTLWRIPLAAIGISIAIALAIPFSSQRITEMKGFFPNAGKTDPIGNSINMRQIIWRVDMHMLRQHWLGGVGPGHLKTELANQYFALGTLTHLPMEYYDTHNEYLNIWISFGLIGIILFLFILIFQLVSAIRRREHLYICLLAIMGICFATENILANQRGVIFYSFFTALLFFALPQQKKYH